MRKLVLILIAVIAVVTFIRAVDNDLVAEEHSKVAANEAVLP